MPEPATLVVGIGNEHRGDDAAGLLAVRALRENEKARTVAELREHGGEGASLIELWSGRSRVILIDALHDPRPPGTIVHLDRFEAIADASGQASTHAFGLAGALELARTLDRLPERLEIYGICGNRFAIGSDPRELVRRAAHEVASAILESL